MLRLKRAFMASIIGLCSIQPLCAAGLPVIDSPAELKTPESVIFTDGQAINLNEMREKYKDSPSTLAYIDTLKPGIHANNAMLSIIDLNLTAARNADLEASAEGRSATKEDIERHKEYILKSQAQKNINAQAYEDQRSGNDQDYESTPLSNKISDINDQLDFTADILKSTFPVIIFMFGLLFLYRTLTR